MRRLQRTIQLALFHSPSHCPHWQSLPAPIKTQVIQLLARLMREHRAKANATGQPKEAGDE
jgi:hypothetical protein